MVLIQIRGKVYDIYSLKFEDLLILNTKYIFDHVVTGFQTFKKQMFHN